MRRYYSRRHYERLSNGGPDTAETIAERVRYQQIAEQANSEMMGRFAPLTATNAKAAIDWQEARIKELLSMDR